MIFFVLSGLSLKGQILNQPAEGTVSFITSQNVYVKFASTENIKIGDTLFILQNDKLFPVLIVKFQSTISCACVPISEIKLNVQDKVMCRQKEIHERVKADTVRQSDIKPAIQEIDTNQVEQIEQVPKKQVISGYISIASHSMFSNLAAGNSLRMRYNLSLTVKNIANSKFSAESYISFNHKNNHWDEVAGNIFNGLKIYNLALNYEINKNCNLLLGRKINPMISNMGAVDGLQFKMKLGLFTLGLLAGARPDYRDYGFNFNLLQFGGYTNHGFSSKNGPVLSTLAFIQQTNRGKTDRRFIYFQHSNQVIPNLSFYGSIEFEMYKKTLVRQDTSILSDSTYLIDNGPRVANIYSSIRYRLSRKISFSVSYSARQNIIYYETYKSLVDRLLQSGTRQGFFIQANFRPSNKLSMGTTLGYHLQLNDIRPTRNINTYLTYSQLPGLGVTATVSVMLMQTSNLSGNIYRLNLSRDIVPGKLFGGMNYSYIDYRFYNTESVLPQNVGEVSLTWKIASKLSFSAYFEGTFEKLNQYNRLYVQLNKRF